ncbi:MAG: DUF3459 domain-containing protein [Lachnospiraceae bacterium]|nr:DUF3459 domain-containing protein [Lachnospiraceae bacterium]
MKRKLGIILAGAMAMSLGACAGGGTEPTKAPGSAAGSEAQTAEETTAQQEAQYTALELMEKYNTAAEDVRDDKYRTFYEVFLYSFYDSDGDGIGDIRGLIDKLDYINDGDPATDTDLAATGIWLMPMMPSPSYHKYDVTDYYAIDPAYGTLDDYKDLLAECHKRNINVIIDLVLNHTSSEHPWFTQACDYLRTLKADEESDPEVCPYVDYYEFTKTPSGAMYAVTGTDWYYRGEFTYTMPDLNLDNEGVRKEIADIANYWLDMGTDGFRLDAVLYYYESNTIQNVAFLKWFNDLCKASYPDTYIVGECWKDMTTYAQYYESGIDSLFNFDWSGAEGGVVKAVKQAGRYKKASDYAAALEELSQRLGEYETAIDAPFFTNHDMGRGAGYFYSPGNALPWTKMGIAVNLLMEGNAFIYYGEELGMSGSGADENKRAPMLWSTEKVQGMCAGPAGYKASHSYPGVDVQSADGDSILNFTRQVIKLRNAYPAIARGSSRAAQGSGDAIAVIERSYGGETVYVVMNLSKESATLRLSDCDWYAGHSAIGGVLLTTAEDISVEGGQLTMPRDSVVIFTAK